MSKTRAGSVARTGQFCPSGRGARHCQHVQVVELDTVSETAEEYGSATGQHRQSVKIPLARSVARNGQFCPAGRGARHLQLVHVVESATVSETAEEYRSAVSKHRHGVSLPRAGRVAIAGQFCPRCRAARHLQLVQVVEAATAFETAEKYGSATGQHRQSVLIPLARSVARAGPFCPDGRSA